MKKNLKIGLGLSGGVDSAVSLLLLKKQLAHLNCFYINCFQNNFCSNNQDRNDSFLTAQQLQIKFQTLNLITEYQKKVLAYFFKSLKNGQTPNPDIWCNQEIKFGLFYQYLKKHHYDFMATGHYSQIIKINHHYFLATSYDLDKDQSYFLCQLEEKQLPFIKFPIGHLKKTSVRLLAKKHHLLVSNKKDSMGICFLGNLNFHYLLKNNLGEKNGTIVDSDGFIIGHHKGHWFYTLGQKITNLNFHLLSKSNLKEKINKHLLPKIYVIAKNYRANQIVVGIKKQTLKKSFFITNLHSIYSQFSLNSFFKTTKTKTLDRLSQTKKLEATNNILVKLRNTGKFLACNLSKNKKGLKIILKEKTAIVAQGQFAVFYLPIHIFVNYLISDKIKGTKLIKKYPHVYICLGNGTIC